jgi:hypothetical protein
MKSFLTLLFLIGYGYCSGQIPKQTSMQIYLAEGGVPLQGTKQLTVRWYSVPIGGSAESTETLSVNFTNGYASLVLGSIDAVPDTLLMRGTVWLGLQVESTPEYSPRTMVLSTPFARIAQRAMEAQSLSKEVTGVVTSVNEIAGNVILVGGRNIGLQRTGPVITISTLDEVEYGEVLGNGAQHMFSITPKTKIVSASHVTLQVASATTCISATIVELNEPANTILVSCAAPLTNGEALRWMVHR